MLTISYRLTEPSLPLLGSGAEIIRSGKWQGIWQHPVWFLDALTEQKPNLLSNPPGCPLLILS
jgi:hypothetical protein